MRNGELDIQERMLGYVCGSLDADERAAFEARLADDAQLTRQVNALRRLLKPLDTWEAPEPVATFVDDVIHRVRNITPLEYVAATAPVTPEHGSAPPRQSWMSLGGLMAAAACVALVMGLLMPGMANRRNQAMCEMNLAGFGQGMHQYAATFDGAMPNIGRNPNANWIEQPNRLHLRPMLIMRVIDPNNLFCPTTADGAIDNEAALKNIDEFLRNSNVRWYSHQNGNGPVPLVIARLRMPVAADHNPRFPHSIFDPNVPSTANSHAHGGRGQNVLFFDGSMRFLRSPVMGETADNIYEAEDVKNYTGTETQRSATDAFLIP